MHLWTHHATRSYLCGLNIQVHATDAKIEDEECIHLRVDSARGSNHLPPLTKDEALALRDALNNEAL